MKFTQKSNGPGEIPKLYKIKYDFQVYICQKTSFYNNLSE